MKLRTFTLILIVFCITFYTACSGKNTSKDNEQTTSIQTSENTDISVSPNSAEPTVGSAKATNSTVVSATPSIAVPPDITDSRASTNTVEPATVNKEPFYGKWVISKVIASSLTSAYTTELITGHLKT